MKLVLRVEGVDVSVASCVAVYLPMLLCVLLLLPSMLLLLLMCVGMLLQEEKQRELRKELSVTTTQMRKRSLGNMLFIGELFKLQMISEAIMHDCITRLLKSTSDEEALEGFGKLIMTTGKDLDKPKAKVGGCGQVSSFA